MAARRRNVKDKASERHDHKTNGVHSKASTHQTEDTVLFYAVIVLLLMLLSGGLCAYYLVTDADILAIQSKFSSILGSSPSVPENVQKENSQKETWRAQSEAAGMAAKPADNPKPKSTKGYSKKSITCDSDNRIRGQLDNADRLYDEGKFMQAQEIYETILSRHPSSPRATYGKASTLDKLSEEKRSNGLLEQCIEEYRKVIELSETPAELAVMAAKRGSDRATFRGWSSKGANMVKRCIERFPSEYLLNNNLGVQYLMSGANEKARDAFASVLKQDPNNGFALVHMGFIIKTHDDNSVDSIPYLRKGIESGAPGTLDGRFFFHLGDAYFRIGQANESYEIYKRGAEHGLYPSFWQRSLYNVNGLTAQPWWTNKQTGNAKYLKELESNWETIRDEGLANMDMARGAFVPEDENLRETGEWKQFTLFQRGQKNEKACRKAPKTCALIEKFQDAANCKRGQVKYSVMQPGVHVWPHCGPTNCRIRAHLGLVVPEGPIIRVSNETRTWKEGKFIIFDDSFEHEVWHKGNSMRLVLIVDMWHPDLSAHQKATLSPI